MRVGTTIRRTVAVVALALVAATVRQPPAFADDSVDVPISSSPPIVINFPDGNTSTPINVEIPATQSGQQPVATQCTPIPGVPSTLCVGQPVGVDQTPLEVTGLAEAAPVVKAGGDAASALGWMIPEAIEYIRTTYDVPNDQRILRYARPQIRAYMLNRLLDIMDRKVFGVTLTDDEQRALDFVENEYGLDDRTLAQAAYDQYQAFEGTGGCGYSPPAPPAGTPFKALPLPKNVRDACTNAQGEVAQLFAFAPPIPSVDDFTTWGAYSKAHDLGLDAFANDAVKRNTATATVAGVMAAGLALSVAAATIVGIVTATSAILAEGIATAIGSSALIIGSSGLTAAGSAVAVGVFAATGIVAVVILELAILAVSIWQVVQRESVGVELKKRVDDATGADPLGLDALIPTYTGKPLRQGFTPKNLPAYRSAAATNKLMANIVRWTTIDDDGSAIPDATTLWDGNATTDQDRTFLVRVGTGQVQEKQSISVPQADGFATVRFSRNWMIVKQKGQPEAAALSFGYRDIDGTDKLAMRAPGANGGWVVASDGGDVPVAGDHQDTLSYKNANGERVRVQLKPLPYATLSGPRPSAVGPLYTARPVILRPNPVSSDGSTIDYTASQTDFSYDWTVQRFDTDSQQWVDVSSADDTYGPSFTPTVPGQYRADVTMTEDANPSNKKYGVVEFTITSPPISTPTLTLIDNGSDQVELDLQMTEPVAGDTITTRVTWPEEIGSGNLPDTTLLTQTCVQTGPLECTTPRTSPLNLAVHDLTSASDLRQPVTVTMTNSTGGTITQNLTFDNPGRPTFESPPAGSNDTMPGTVSVDGQTAQVDLPLRDQGVSDYQVATVVPGSGGGQEFGLVDPATGNTAASIPLPGAGGLYATIAGDELRVFGTPTVRDLGTYEVPIVVSQTNTNRNLFIVAVHIVPATGNRFRGGLQSDVDPTDFAVDTLPEMYPAVFGGQADWGPYDGDLCVSLEYVSGGPPVPRQACGPLGLFYGDAGDGKVKPFPFAQLSPEGMASGQYRAHAWIPDAGEHVDTQQLTTSFVLTAPASFGTPKVLVGPSITGTPQVGGRLTAHGSTIPDGASATYQWLRDGKAIAGATQRRYTLVAKDRKHHISVRVKAKAKGYDPGTGTSPETVKVAAGVLQRTPTPTVDGRADVGRTLTAVPGRWDKGVTFSYRWFAGSTRIKGATGKKLELTKAMKGKRVTVQVTGKKPGYAAVTRESKPTKKV